MSDDAKSSSPRKSPAKRGVQYSEETEAAIADFVTSEFCRQDKDLTTQINELFPTEQSLNQLESVISTVEGQILELDCELANLVETHATAGKEGEDALKEAQAAMAQLEKKIESIRGKTQSSDEVVREMTRDIHQLDIAKRNLTAAITTLHHLHILLTGVDDLGSWIARRNYASIARQLPAVLNVLQLFDSFRENEQIRAISERLDKLKHTLTLQLAGDMKSAFQAGTLNESVTDMCRVAAALEGNVKENFCKWFIERQLSEYTVLYAENEEAAWLDKIEDRYKWYVRRLTDFERSGLSAVFPNDWDMGRQLTRQFCIITKDILIKMMTRRRQDLDWKLLGHAIQHTKMFESLLVKRFPAKGQYNFDKALWESFDQFLDVFIAAQEKTLNDFIDGCAQKIRNGNERPSRETCLFAVPLPSSADLFLLLKKVITESSKLSSQPDALLKDIVTLLRSCLRGFAHSCLTAFLPQQSSGSSIATTVNLFNLIRDDTIPIRLTPDQQFLTCCILATADWCAETTIQLQEKLVQRLTGIDLSQETETFYNLANSAIVILVADVEGACDAAIQAMTKTNWMGVDAVGDESPFIGSIRTHLKQGVPVIRDLLSDRRKYFAHFCLKLATQLSHKFVGSIFRCRPISMHGAEQLLLDTHALKTFLLTLPSIESQVQTKPPVAYTNAISSALTKAEMILKIVMHDISIPEQFVATYCSLLPQSDLNELQKVLEMKGVRRADQSSIVAAYRSHLGIDDGQLSTQPRTATEILTSVVSDAGGLADTSMRRLERLVKKV
ncbi:unnamed protein product, partial [Mesorhabditis belari]|uniref:Vacuolar protein sorting-associated protein 53 homolog n=1 Tax=Mesorhabditis belari TaxID=2138241 RepID=A0AAF3EAH0_9BILA